MKVKDLIKKLQEFDPEFDVAMRQLESECLMDVSGTELVTCQPYIRVVNTVVLYTEDD